MEKPGIRQKRADNTAAWVIVSPDVAVRADGLVKAKASLTLAYFL